jgi:hypothetical protein
VAWLAGPDVPLTIKHRSSLTRRPPCCYLVELLVGPWSGVGKLDEVRDLGAAEAGDQHGTHAVTPGPRS